MLEEENEQADKVTGTVKDSKIDRVSRGGKVEDSEDFC